MLLTKATLFALVVSVSTVVCAQPTGASSAAKGAASSVSGKTTITPKKSGVDCYEAPCPRGSVRSCSVREVRDANGTRKQCICACIVQ